MRHVLLPCALLAALFFPSLAFAVHSEIWYGTISRSMRDSVLLTYKGPSGERNFSCSTKTGRCDDSEDTGLPSISGSTSYAASPQGTYGVVMGDTGYEVYDITGRTPKKVTSIEYAGSATRVRFSPDENVVVLQRGSEITAYNISDRKLFSITASQTDFPNMSVSYRGTYLAAYSYQFATNRIWNLQTGKMTEVPSTRPSYVEFSEDEEKAVYLDIANDYAHLFEITFASGTTSAPRPVTSGSYNVEDYLFIGNTLFYLANKESPLTWSLYERGNSGTANRISEQVSYGDFLKRTNDGLGYLVVDGKATHANVYNPATKATLKLRPFRSTASAPKVKREEIRVAGRTGALLTPVRGRGNLFIWLHGGPARQTSLLYHPYLSYAVYDELLERLVSAGNTVLKLDYTGSTGYTETLQNGLNQAVGKTDVSDVLRAAEELTKSNSYENVYLIGNSYGGYLALRTLVEGPELIDGAISINGVTDWYGLITRIPSSPFHRLFAGIPDHENFGLYRQASIYDRVNKLDEQKVLIAYGSNDRTVPTWQSLELFNYLDQEDKNVELLRFSDEEHVLRKRSTLNKLCREISREFDLPGVRCR